MISTINSNSNSISDKPNIGYVRPSDSKTAAGRDV